MPNARILLVDDHPANLLALHAVLAPLAEIVTANSGMEALERLKEHDFAVVLLDLLMPVMDGFETAARIKCQGARSTSATGARSRSA